MRSCWQVVALLALCASCDLYFSDPPATLPGDAAIDARTPDASYQPPPRPPCPQGPLYYRQLAGCSASQGAWASTYYYYMGAGSHSMCSVPLQSSKATCANGCAITGYVDLYAEPAADIAAFASAAQVLCAETPVAKAGDACNALGTAPCLPTRARLNNDGTVEGHDYLTCDATGTCVAAAAPVIAGYLQPCDATTLAEYGTPGVNGLVVSPFQQAPYVHRPMGCLLAWNDQTQAIASGLTPFCVGDWQCPAGSLCDDQVPLIDGWRNAVCKPGPRGVLTPAMLSP